MQLFGLELTLRRKAAVPLQPLSTGRDGWFPVVREPYTGAWQQNVEIRPDSLLSNPTVFACITRISQDIAKCRLRLMQQATAELDIWLPTTNPAYSPVLRRPNHYQTPTKFIEQWIASKLMYGNTFVLKQRDGRGVVTGLYILNPTGVTPLVAPDGSVFYQLRRPDQDLAGSWPDPARPDVTVPAREIIHDRINCLFHPLVGLSPLYAAGVPATLGLTIQRTSTSFFAKGSTPSGTLSSELEIPQERADRLQADWQNGFAGPENAGKIVVLGWGMKYQELTRTAVDSQLVEQMDLTEGEICKPFGMPVALLNTSKGAPYGNRESLVQMYHDECLQTLMVGTETALDEGLGIDLPVNGTQYGVEFDIDDLYWMDTATRTKAAADSVSGGVLSTNEARLKYFGLPPVPGGESPMAQQQYYSLAALAERDADQPFSKPTPATPAQDAAAPGEEPA